MCVSVCENNKIFYSDFSKGGGEWEWADGSTVGYEGWASAGAVCIYYTNLVGL